MYTPLHHPLAYADKSTYMLTGSAERPNRPIPLPPCELLSRGSYLSRPEDKPPMFNVVRRREHASEATVDMDYILDEPYVNSESERTCPYLARTGMISKASKI